MAITQKGLLSKTAIEKACACLKNADLRITQPRISILTSLINRSVPATIDQIHGDLPPDTCDLVTVYRCLATFQRIGLVRLSYFHNGSSAYQITLDSNVEPPYHLISKKDNEVRELDPISTAELRAVIAKVENRLRASGFDQVSHIVEFFAENATVQVPQDILQDNPRLAAPVEEIPGAMPDALQMRAISTAPVEA